MLHSHSHQVTGKATDSTICYPYKGQLDARYSTADCQTVIARDEAESEYVVMDLESAGLDKQPWPVERLQEW